MKNSNTFKFLPALAILILVSVFALVTGDLHGFQIDNAQEITATVRFVTTDGNCGGATPCYSSIQSAVDAANTGDEIRVATGTYTGITTKTDLNQTNFTARQLVAITKTITLRGGYTTADWNTSDPTTNETILDAERNGRVMIIMGEIAPIIDGFTITHGDATGLGGKLTYDNLCAPPNYPIDGGGGLYIARANATIRNNKITNNLASTANWSGGGGIMLNCSSATITKNEISLNTANGSTSSISNDAKGGGIFATGTGGISSATIAPLISNNLIQFNVAGGDGADGGGIYAAEAIAITISGNEIKNNDTTLSAVSGNGSGGGIYVARTNNHLITISSNSILINGTGSSSFGFGGGVFVYNVTDFTVHNNIIADNRANGAGAGAMIWGFQGINMAGKMINNTITTNYGAAEGLFIEGTSFVGSDTNIGSLSMTNNIFSNHTRAYRVYTADGLTMTINDNYTLWDGSGTYNSISGAGSIVNTNNQLTGNPGLVGFGNYHLTSASDAINAGLDTGLNSDIDGDLRPIGAGVDIGADEIYVESVISTGGGTIDGTDAQGHGISINVPADAVDQATTFYLTPQADVGQSHATLSFAGQTFDLYAEQNGSVVPNFTFLTPVTLTISYADEDVAGVGEDTLQLLYWNGSAWSSDGITFVSRDTVNNSLTVTISHLTEFAMFGESYRVYLPVVMK